VVGGMMKQFPAAIERPICRCGIRTMLTRISPDAAGFDACSFECPNCDQVVTERIATDPLEKANGWGPR